MKTDQYSILFSSLTGNTKKLADAIHETLPEAKLKMTSARVYLSGQNLLKICITSTKTGCSEKKNPSVF